MSCGLGGGSNQQQVAQKQAQNNAIELSNHFQTLFKEQQGLLSELSNYTAPLLNGKGINEQGFAAPALNAMRTNATDQTSAAFNNAEQALQTQQLQRGLADNLPSGVSLAQAAGLESKQALAQSQAQNNITIQDYMQGIQNYMAGLSSMENQANIMGAGEGVAVSGATGNDKLAAQQANVNAASGFNLTKLLAGAVSAMPFLGTAGSILSSALSAGAGLKNNSNSSSNSGGSGSTNTPSGSADITALNSLTNSNAPAALAGQGIGG